LLKVRVTKTGREGAARQGFLEVVLRLDDQEVDSALGQGAGLLAVDLFELRLGELSLGLEELARGSHASGHVLPFRSRPAGDTGRGRVQLADSAFQAMGRQFDPVPAEAVGRYGVRSRLEIAGVDFLDDIGPLDVPCLRACPDREAVPHQFGPHTAVEKDRPLFDEIEDRSLHALPPE
jgi:hypothetical protein